MQKILHKAPLLLMIIGLVAGMLWIIKNPYHKETLTAEGLSANTTLPDTQSITTNLPNVPERLQRNFQTDFTQSSIDLAELLPGGPTKDGIPSIDNPTFVSIAEAEKEGLDDETLGMFVQSGNGGKFYPYTILVWHEIVNDLVDGVPVSITFCPLCGSAIGYERTLPDGTVTTFGVSGMLRESNMVMYDRATESLWQQSDGVAIVGNLINMELTHIPVNIIEFSEIKAFHTNAQVLSRNTGYIRNYGVYPYGNYNENENFIFPTSAFSDRFFSKELFEIIILPNNGGELAIMRSRVQSLENDESITHADTGITITKKDGILAIRDKNGEQLAHYVEMWFSWVIHQNPNENNLIWE